MGRLLKRVPLDFKWPLKQVWIGYIDPYSSSECSACKGSGMSPELKKLSDDWYTHLRTDGEEGWGHHLVQEEVNALVKANRLADFTRRPRTDKQRAQLEKDGGYWLKRRNGYIPTAEEINKWSKGRGMGHDSVNHWICVKVRAKRLGIADGKCEYCKGEGEFWFSPKIKRLSDKFEKQDPPTGEGYQLWENTSEGSPLSPVFKTPEELCAYAEYNCTVFGSDKVSAAEWMRMLFKEKSVMYQQGNVAFI